MSIMDSRLHDSDMTLHSDYEILIKHERENRYMLRLSIGSCSMQLVTGARMAHFHLAQTTEPIAKSSRFYISTCVDLFAFANLIALYDTRYNFRDYLIPTIRGYQFYKFERK